MEDSDASADSALREDSGRSEDSGSPQDSAPPEDSGPSEEAPDLSQDGSLTVGVSTHDILNRDGLDMRLELWFPSLDAGEQPTVHDGYWDGASFQGVSPHCDEPRPSSSSHGNG